MVLGQFCQAMDAYAWLTTKDVSVEEDNDKPYVLLSCLEISLLE